MTTPTVVDADGRADAISGRSTVSLGLCFMVPILWVIQGWIVVFSRAPMWQNLADPAYVYLEGSAEVASGQSSFANQHPGTPLYLIMALTDRLFHLFSGLSAPFLGDVVARADAYLVANGAVLVFAQGCGLVAFGWVMARRFGVGSALVGQSAIVGVRALSDTSVSPVPLQIAVALFLLAAVVPVLDGGRPPVATARLIVVGVLLALGLTAKLTFLPLLALPLLLFRWRQLLVIYAWFAGAATVIILATARADTLDAAVWWRNFLLSSGRTPGDTSAPGLLTSVAQMPSAALGSSWILLVGMASVCVCVAVHAFVRPATGTTWVPWRGFAALGLVVLMSVLATVKSYRPWDLVFIPIAAAAVVALAWAWLTASSGLHVSRIVRIGVPTVAVVLAALWCVVSIDPDVRRATPGTDYLRLVDYADATAESGRPVATAYGVFTPATAAYFGLWFTHRSLAPEIVKAYPNWYEYKLDDGHFYRFTDSGEVRMTCEELKTLINGPGGLTWIPGRDVEFAADSGQYSDLQKEPIASFGSQTVYRMTGITCP